MRSTDEVYGSLAYDGAPLLRVHLCVSRAFLVFYTVWWMEIVMHWFECRWERSTKLVRGTSSVRSKQSNSRTRSSSTNWHERATRWGVVMATWRHRDVMTTWRHQYHRRRHLQGQRAQQPLDPYRLRLYRPYLTPHDCCCHYVPLSLLSSAAYHYFAFMRAIYGREWFVGGAMSADCTVGAMNNRSRRFHLTFGRDSFSSDYWAPNWPICWTRKWRIYGQQGLTSCPSTLKVKKNLWKNMERIIRAVGVVPFGGFEVDFTFGCFFLHSELFCLHEMRYFYGSMYRTYSAVIML